MQADCHRVAGSSSAIVSLLVFAVSLWPGSLTCLYIAACSKAMELAEAGMRIVCRLARQTYAWRMAVLKSRSECWVSIA